MADRRKEMAMKVLVVYASRHGATRGIAERIAETLAGRGLEVAVRAAKEAGDVSSFDAFVIGSAAYMGRWLQDATSFVNQHRAVLAARPVWLFSSGPVGTDLVDAKGRDVRTAAAPKEFSDFRDALHPRDERIFFGAYDPSAPPVGMAEGLGMRVMRLMPAARAALPAGDFRDWPEIEAWAASIGDALTVAAATA
jgi:menaquinone-dependent protoporphyrinogen oxidase